MGQTPEDRWEIMSEASGTISSVLTEEYKLIDQVSSSEWTTILTYVAKNQPKIPVSGSANIWNKLTEDALFNVSKVPTLSPKDMDEKKDKLLDKFKEGEITKEKLEQELRSLEGSMYSPTFSGGFFDSPKDLGKGEGRGDFPSQSWFPKGQESKTVSTDVVTGRNPTFDQPKDSVQDQIEKKYGPEYNQVFLVLIDARDNKKSLEEVMANLISNSNYVLDPEIVRDIAKEYVGVK